MKNNSYRLKVGWAATDYPINMHSCVRSRADQPLKAVLSLTHFCYEECSCLSFLAMRCHCDTLPRLSQSITVLSTEVCYSRPLSALIFTVISHLALCNRFITLAWIHSMISSKPGSAEDTQLQYPRQSHFA